MKNRNSTPEAVCQKCGNTGQAERPNQPKRYTADVFHPNRPYYMAQTTVVRAADFDAFAAQYERIVGALRFERQQMDSAFTACINERDAALARVSELETKLTELENQEPVAWLYRGTDMGDQLSFLCLNHYWRPKYSIKEHDYIKGVPLYAAPPAQAQHSVPEEFSFEYRHPNGECHTVTVSREQVINEMPDFLFEALCSKFCNCEPVGETNVVECCCDEYAEEFKLIAAAPGKEVGHE
ncbi:hypothetical protein [Pseudomonas phage vB_PaeM_RP7]|uniref:Uncharacterized protein n=1 Tax=Pseudomonas phage PAP-JP TaxID=2583508 RepID=A0A5C1K535_9CAUD|nr:hypothetical protein PAPJP_125 [Pseudomonas phage PAP-JP]WAB56996.1 hypothetical protein [Pseudomonas phage vB_PaeM_RP6]WAB57095.1 hypothetical protein [Pseudomonas phage vB_PaeM_RP7]WAB57232.1 hypothetical protein [Pseudomonas phage vB_PaeM_RP8]WAB57623.1 hypothetical protein [Pseudomonas phage vB_PaeM_RP10]